MEGTAEPYRALREFARDVSELFCESTDGGMEIPFDVVEEGRGSAVLYSYRALTAEFIDQHWSKVRLLKSYHAATAELVHRISLTAYLEKHRRSEAVGDRPLTADVALAFFIKRIWQEAANFRFDRERFEQAYAQLDEHRDADHAELIELHQPGDQGEAAAGFAAPDMEALRRLFDKLKKSTPTLLRSLRADLSPSALVTLGLDEPGSTQQDSGPSDDRQIGRRSSGYVAPTTPTYRKTTISGSDEVAQASERSRALPVFGQESVAAVADWESAEDFSAPV